MNAHLNRSKEDFEVRCRFNLLLLIRNRAYVDFFLPYVRFCNSVWSPTSSAWMRPGIGVHVFSLSLSCLRFLATGSGGVELRMHLGSELTPARTRSRGQHAVCRIIAEEINFSRRHAYFPGEYPPSIATFPRQLLPLHAIFPREVDAANAFFPGEETSKPPLVTKRSFHPNF